MSGGGLRKGSLQGKGLGCLGEVFGKGVYKVKGQGVWGRSSVWKSSRFRVRVALEVGIFTQTQ